MQLHRLFNVYKSLVLGACLSAIPTTICGAIMSDTSHKLARCPKGYSKKLHTYKVYSISPIDAKLLIKPKLKAFRLNVF